MKLSYFWVAVGLGLGVTSVAWAQLPLASRPMPSVDGGSVTLTQLQGTRGLVIVFWSNRCPWVDRYEARLNELAETYKGQGIRFVLVNANDAGAFPQESLEASAAQARRKGYALPYVRDEGSALARALGASRTPEVFVFTAQGRLLYRGAIDDSPGDAANVQQAYLREALEALLQGKQPATTETSAFGCLIRFAENGP
ncbi:thioredoxin family protein [Rhodothermus bifroesti]|jgi:thiol-disulfide isomerase/thioredoxin|uniref:thioredoxin family protein n=1 Tax=Rhodothermus bifroesti TaxID=2823335 RepID=UPI000CB47B29|nr:thioredoxin family protein [Rhodothermus bifroesti]GBD00931.1 hypothetical protein HRbin18_00648 [bacterium HR18]